MEGIISESTHAARKYYDCSCCGRMILPGDDYTRAYVRPEWMYSSEKPIDAKLCTRCHTPASKMTVRPGGEDGYEYIRRRYGVPVKVGQRIMVDGIVGIVVRPLHHQHYVHFIQDGGKRPKMAHPTWETVYYNDDGTVAADYRQATGVA